ncbi:hypothetical protein E2C01_046672 [Portunus trituberculatus]|uniref:Uncharacterized protein n=1 Tax=Portunus trituberculatus TaxID=210409 RepID=A0A5B7G6B8_PORTR|nr:hypothetical protein [Portunus trituberculatus]
MLVGVLAISGVSIKGGVVTPAARSPHHLAAIHSAARRVSRPVSGGTLGTPAGHCHGDHCVRLPLGLRLNNWTSVSRSCQTQPGVSHLPGTTEGKTHPIRPQPQPACRH